MEQWGFYFDQTRCVNCKACVMACKAWNDDKRGDAALHPGMNWLADGRYAEPAEYENLPGSSGEQNYEEYRKYHMKENWRRVTATEYGDIPPNVDVLNLSISCNHCDHPACMDVCATKYIFKEPEYGIVLTDPSKKCTACGRCSKACPWGSPQFYDTNLRKYGANDPARPRMTKCTLCIDRIRDGLKPACVAACIMRALDAGPVNELMQKYPGCTDEVENLYDMSSRAEGLKLKPNILFKKKSRKV